MPKPSEIQLGLLGDAVLPFERSDFKRKVLEGENLKKEFVRFVYDATDNDYPSNTLKASAEDIMEGRAENQKYLWVINKGGLFVIPEQTKNPKAGRGVVCHTNLTGGEAANQGGELWFDNDGTVYINNKSGRYGATTLSQRNAVIDYFRFVGYKNVKQLK